MNIASVFSVTAHVLRNVPIALHMQVEEAEANYVHRK